MEKRSIISGVDTTSFWIYVALVLIGWLNIYAAVYDADSSSILDITQNYGKQLIWIGSGAAIIMFILLLDGKFISNFSWVIYGFTIVLLIMVLLMARNVNGNRSWIDIGSFKLQPSEFAKFATALALAKYISSKNLDLSRLSAMAIPLCIIGLPVALIMLQGDTGSAITYGAFLLVFFREGMSGSILYIGVAIVILFLLTLLLPKIALIIGLAVLAVCVMYYFRRKTKYIAIVALSFSLSVGTVLGVDFVYNNVLKPHHRDRINIILGKKVDMRGIGYNLNQSKIAIGSGGIIGKGFLNGTQTKYDFVPEQSTDFIFCTIGEEYGFVGSLVLLGLFVLLLFRLIDLAERQRSTFSRVYIYSVLSILFLHLAINVGMTIGLVPVIGIPLPFISYGGSSMWGFTILLFLGLKMDESRAQIIR